MKKLLSVAFAAIAAVTLLPIASNATHCPGSVPSNDTVGGAYGAYSDSGTFFISSGPRGTVPDNDATNGYQNLGAQGCRNTAQEGMDEMDTRYLTPEATGLIIVAYNFPNDTDHKPAPGCYKFNGTPNATCDSGAKVITWTRQKFFPGVRNTDRWISANIAIPANATSITAYATLQPEDPFKPKAKLTTKYRVLSAP